MKLFNRGKEEEVKPAAPAPAAVAAPGALPAPLSAPVPPAAAPAADGEFTAALDASVKEMSEKLARLSTSLDTAQQDRQGFEEKMHRMEDRLRKLSSLTEMISAPYNPFIGDAPQEGGPLSSRATPTPGPAAGAVSAVPLVTPAAPAATESPPLVTLAPAMPGLGEAASPADFPDVAEAEADVAPSDFPPVAAAFGDDDDASDVAAAGDAFDARDVHLERVERSFQNSLLMLNWSDMLLKSARSREGLREIVDYYQALGWIGSGTRDALLAYAEGLACDPVPEGEVADWRGRADVHERSLLYIEKLKGRPSGG